MLVGDGLILTAAHVSNAVFSTRRDRPEPIAPSSTRSIGIAQVSQVDYAWETLASRTFTEVMGAIRLAQVLDPSGAAAGTFSALPNRARREAVVNGMAHRDWIDAAPVTIELTSTALVVNSPGKSSAV